MGTSSGFAIQACKRRIQLRLENVRERFGYRLRSMIFSFKYRFKGSEDALPNSALKRAYIERVQFFGDMIVRQVWW